MRRVDDKPEVRKAVIRRCILAWPAAVTITELAQLPEVASADGRTLEGELRRLTAHGVLEATVDGTGRTIRASDTAARAILWATGRDAYD